MSKQSVSVDLTVPFVIWSLVFVALAVGTGVNLFWWIAAIPLFITLGFMVFVIAMFPFAYLAGATVTFSGPKYKRTYRRGYSTVKEFK